MKITILGSASGMAVSQRNASSVAVETNKRVYLIDVGDGAARQLSKYGINQNRIHGIFISHTHSDHAAGLFYLLQMMQLTGRRNPMDIYLPRGVLPGFESIFPYFQIYREKWPFDFRLIPIRPGPFFKGDGFQVSAIPNGHLRGNQRFAEKFGMDADSYSFRFQESDENAVIYTSDVDSLDHLKADNDRARILISECTHIDVKDIVDFAASAGIDRTVLTHIPPGLEEKSSCRMGDRQKVIIEFADDGFIIEV